MQSLRGRLNGSPKIILTITRRHLMSDSGCYLLWEKRPCAYPGKKERGACSGITYSEVSGFQEEPDGPCPYYWVWDGTEDIEDSQEC
jgi:hypothetical protein